MPDAAALIVYIENLVDARVDSRMSSLYPREEDAWYTTAEAARYLGIALGTVRNLACAGVLPRHGPPGTRLRFRRSELDRYAEERRGAGERL